MAFTIGVTIESLSWADSIFLYDDSSTDGTVDVASKAASVPLIVEHSHSPRSAFERGEKAVRNLVLSRAAELSRCQTLAVVDADEILTADVLPLIDRMQSQRGDGISLSTWHLWDTRHYLHFWEGEVNGVQCIDPHVRIVPSRRRFVDIFPDGTHPALIATSRTLGTNEPLHFHLKYLRGSPYPNRTLSFLPEKLSAEAVKPYLRELPFELPRGVERAVTRLVGTR